MWDAYVLPHLGSHPLRDLTPTVINRFRLELEAQGVGRMSIAKTMTLLQGVLQRACEWERLASNPVRAVRKPRPAPRRSVTPLSPETVEQMRLWLLNRDRVRDATLVSVPEIRQEHLGTRLMSTARERRWRAGSHPAYKQSIRARLSDDPDVARIVA